jgi:hypothetical protein
VGLERKGKWRRESKIEIGLGSKRIMSTNFQNDFDNYGIRLVKKK